MSCFLLHHRHAPEKCGVAYAAFRGHESPLRHTDAIASCPAGGHEIWWVVEADSSEEALALLPPYLARRSDATPIRRVHIP